MKLTRLIQYTTMTYLITKDMTNVFDMSKSLWLVYDIEACGNPSKPRECRIWELSIQNLFSGKRFECVVNPWPNGKEDEEKFPEVNFAGSTPLPRDELKAAPVFSAVGPKLLAWIQTQMPESTEPCPVIFISHGNFTLDKPLLENEMYHANLMCPKNWLFFDTLPFFRTTMRKQPSYSLRSLYQSRFGEDILNHHRASTDVEALCALLYREKMPYVGAYYPPYFKPLQMVRYIGSFSEILLLQSGIQCVMDLKSVFIHECRMNARDFAHFLEMLGISRDSADKIQNSMLHVIFNHVL